MGRVNTESFSYKFKLFIKNKLALVGLLILFFVFTLVFFGPALSTYDAYNVNFSVKLQPPSGAHILGTDNYGRDLLSRSFAPSPIKLRLATHRMPYPV